MSIISVFPGKGKPKLEAGSASPLTTKNTYSPSGDNEGFSSFTVNAMPAGVLEKPSIQQPNANGRVYATAGVSKAGYLSTGETTENYIDLPTQSGATITPGTAPKIAIYQGRFATDDVWVDGDIDLLPANIRYGVNIFGVTGEWNGLGGHYTQNVNGASDEGDMYGWISRNAVFVGNTFAPEKYKSIMPDYVFLSYFNIAGAADDPATNVKPIVTSAYLSKSGDGMYFSDVCTVSSDSGVDCYYGVELQGYMDLYNEVECYAFFLPNTDNYYFSYNAGNSGYRAALIWLN